MKHYAFRIMYYAILAALLAACAAPTPAPTPLPFAQFILPTYDPNAATASTRLALVHGDISPKNILCGPAGPVILDAECAWYGDPAFDLAFVLNHLLLKCAWLPAAGPAFLNAFDALFQAYRAGIDWEPAPALERRAARLLGGLLLARIDGKSPVEYLTHESQRDPVRQVARALLLRPPDSIVQVRAAFAAGLRIA